MLDQPTEGANVPTPPDKEEEFYVPQLTAEPLNGRAPAPSVKRFTRKTLAVLSAIAAIIVTLAFAVGLQRPARKAASPVESAAPSPLPGPAVSALPGSYQDYGNASGRGEVPQLGEPRPGDVGGFAATNGTRALSPLEQYQQQQNMERVRREDQARLSTVGFAGGGDWGAAEHPWRGHRRVVGGRHRATRVGLHLAQGARHSHLCAAADDSPGPSLGAARGAGAGPGMIASTPLRTAGRGLAWALGVGFLLYLPFVLESRTVFGHRVGNMALLNLGLAQVD